MAWAQLSFKGGPGRTRGEVPSGRYYLGSLSRTSRTFYFSDSRDLLEVLGGLPWRRESDGRPPPDVDLSLNLVIPRFEEYPQKKHMHVVTTSWKSIENEVINLASNPR